MKNRKDVAFDKLFEAHTQFESLIKDCPAREVGVELMQKNIALTQLAIALTLIDIRDELRKMNGGDRDV